MLTSTSSIAKSQQCPALSRLASAKLAAYVASQYEVAPDITVEDNGTVGGTCFRRLTFQIASPKRSIDLYLSPDQHFLTPSLFDISINPEKERHRAATETEQQLLADPSPVRGSQNASISIVVFSDFQCPYCKRLTELLKSLGPESEQVRLVYKQLPLPMHSWARKAALASICTSIQSQDAFWRLHDFLMSQQANITAEHFDEYLDKFVKQDSRVNLEQLRGCLVNKQADATLRRDEMLAQCYLVEGTPTIFINGRRVPGFRSTEELRTVIDQMHNTAGKQALVANYVR